jgi:hypothetical protein
MSWLSKAIDKVLPGAPATKITQNTVDKWIAPENKDTLEAVGTALVAPQLAGAIGAWAGNALGSDALVQPITGAVQSYVTGGNPLMGAIGGALSSGGESYVPWQTPDFSRDPVGALMNVYGMNTNSPATGIAASLGLGLFNNGFTTGNATADSVLQGYLQNRQTGQKGSSGAISGLMDALVGPGWSSIVQGEPGDSTFPGTGGTGSFPVDASWFTQLPSVNVPAGAAETQDIGDLYAKYLSQVNTPQTDDLSARLFNARQSLLSSNYEKQRQALDAELKKRGLYSSGIALKQGADLRSTYANALAQAADTSALDQEKLRQSAVSSAAQLALQMARQQQTTQRALLPSQLSLSALQAQAANVQSAQNQQQRQQYAAMLMQILQQVLQKGQSPAPQPAQTAQGTGTWSIGVPEQILWSRGIRPQAYGGV